MKVQSANAAQLLVYVKCITGGEFLFCEEIEGRECRQDIFGLLVDFKTGIYSNDKKSKMHLKYKR